MWADEFKKVLNPIQEDDLMKVLHVLAELLLMDRSNTEETSIMVSRI